MARNSIVVIICRFLRSSIFLLIMAKVTIIGAGMMGSALAFPIKENGHDVCIVGTNLDKNIIDICKSENKHPKLPFKFPNGVEFYYIEELDNTIKDSDFVICGVSSFGVEWFKDVVLEKIPNGIPILSVTKGLLDCEDGYLMTYPEIWNDKLKELNKTNIVCAIGGPCTSYELVYHDQTHVAFCGYDMDVLSMMKKIMQTSYYHISLTKDVRGIESAVAIKNGYALGIALTIGINNKEFSDDIIHFNSQAMVFGQSVREMKKILELQKSDNIDNLVIGFGDLYVTVYGGRTRQVGILLGEGYTIDEALEKLKGTTLESIVVAKRVAKAIRVKASRGEAKIEDFPLLMCIDDILTKKENVNIPWEKFTFERK